MRIHFIAIGGSAMHNLAIALKGKGYQITGSDDEIFEPSLSRLAKHGLLPNAIGWNPDRITTSLDAVVLGMHARLDNPELIRAKELGVKIYSYPEYLYEQTKDKTRVVIGGSHGKTTITSMVMHVLKYNGIAFDYMVGAQLEGFENMVSLSSDTRIAVFEGDEYLTSPIDRRPKFHLYRPHIGLISGIAWDHINAFPTYPIYLEQFSKFIDTFEPNGTLVFCESDTELNTLVVEHKSPVAKVGYKAHDALYSHSGVSLVTPEGELPIKVFGEHNLMNISGAMEVCLRLGVSAPNFYSAIATFEGAARRLQLLADNGKSRVYFDFAHSPSKVAATVMAMKQAFPSRELVACLELHTFSSLNKDFLPHYNGKLAGADTPIVFFDPHTIEHKKLPPVSPAEVQDSFGNPQPAVFTNSMELTSFLRQQQWEGKNLLIMTSGNFSGVDIKQLAAEIVG